MASIEEIQQYIEFLSTTDIEEIEITLEDGEKIFIKRSGLSLPPTQVTPKVNQSQKEMVPQQSAQAMDEQKVVTEFVITSPMVGRFLLSPSQDHPPYIVEGSHVQQGQKVAVIETMKILRNVVSPKDGIVKKILVEDGKFVEYGQPLIVLEVKQ